jgi:hypothetical protein
MNKNLIAAALIPFLLTLTACGGGGDNSNQSPEPVITTTVIPYEETRGEWKHYMENTTTCTDGNCVEVIIELQRTKTIVENFEEDHVGLNLTQAWWQWTMTSTTTCLVGKECTTTEPVETYAKSTWEYTQVIYRTKYTMNDHTICEGGRINGESHSGCISTTVELSSVDLETYTITIPSALPDDFTMIKRPDQLVIDMPTSEEPTCVVYPIAIGGFMPERDLWFNNSFNYIHRMADTCEDNMIIQPIEHVEVDTIEVPVWNYAKANTMGFGGDTESGNRITIGSLVERNGADPFYEYELEIIETTYVRKYSDTEAQRFGLPTGNGEMYADRTMNEGLMSSHFDLDDNKHKTWIFVAATQVYELGQDKATLEYKLIGEMLAEGQTLIAATYSEVNNPEFQRFSCTRWATTWDCRDDQNNVFPISNPETIPKLTKFMDNQGKLIYDAILVQYKKTKGL